MSGETSSLIELGVVGAPFGVRGWVKLRSFTDPPDRLLQHTPSVQLGLGGVWTTYRIEAHAAQRRPDDGEAVRGE
jgi:16S rRNA processing protein RimM